MRIGNIKTSIQLKKEEGKRVALYNGSKLHLKHPTIAIVDYEQGYYPLKANNGYDYHEMTQEEINQFNKEQGLSSEAIELILNNSMRGA
jgi:hypothetical protein